MSFRYAIAGLGVVLAGLPLAAEAQQRQQVPCDQRAKIVNVLSKEFKESQVGAGLTPGGQVLELYASAKGTWTVLLTMPSGRSCMIATGEDWDARSTPARAPGTPV